MSIVPDSVFTNSAEIERRLIACCPEGMTPEELCDLYAEEAEKVGRKADFLLLARSILRERAENAAKIVSFAARGKGSSSSATDWDAVKQSIKQAIRIEELAADVAGISFTNRGGKLWACCPFHEEKTPSFNIDPDKQLYYCFGCHKGGDVFQFLMDYKNMEFRDALKELAERAGIELPQRKISGAATLPAVDERNEEARRLINEAYAEIEAGIDLRPDALTTQSIVDKFCSEKESILRHCRGVGWLFWNGQKWANDEDAAFREMGVFVKRMYYQAAAKHLGDPNNPDATAYEKFMRKHHDPQKISSFLVAAKALLAIPAANLDADPYALNTPGGIVDLRSGRLLPNAPEAFCTQITNADPSKVDGAELWEEHLNLVTQGDEELKEYLQILFGEALIGEVKTEKLTILVGGGRNGKSTLLNAVSRAVGDYATTFDANCFLIRSNSNSSAEMAALRGKRLVTCGELEDGQTLSTSTLKRIASTDDIHAMPKYKDPISFHPSHHVFMGTNYLPAVKATDEGTWRRLNIAPFDAVMPTGEGEKTDYAAFLAENAGGAILAWCIEGARRFCADNCNILHVPECVKDLVNSKRKSHRLLDLFIEERCEVGYDFAVRPTELYSALDEYAKENGCPRIPQARLRAELEKRDFCLEVRTGNKRFWCGLRLK